MSYKNSYSHQLTKSLTFLGRKVHHRWRDLVGGINKAAEWYRRRLENGSEGPRMDGGHVHSAEARERQRARLPLAVHWAPIGRAREPIRVDGLLPSRHCYKCTNPVYTPVIIGTRSGVDLSEGNVISGFEGLERLERYDLAWQSWLTWQRLIS